MFWQVWLLLLISIAVVTFVFKQIQSRLLLQSPIILVTSSTVPGIEVQQQQQHQQHQLRIKITNPYLYVFGNILSQGFFVPIEIQQSESRIQKKWNFAVFMRQEGISPSIDYRSDWSPDVGVWPLLSLSRRTHRLWSLTFWLRSIRRWLARSTTWQSERMSICWWNQEEPSKICSWSVEFKWYIHFPIPIKMIHNRHQIQAIMSENWDRGLIKRPKLVAHWTLNALKESLPIQKTSSQMYYWQGLYAKRKKNQFYIDRQRRIRLMLSKIDSTRLANVISNWSARVFLLWHRHLL